MNDNGHILVVHDDRAACDLLQAYLTSEGYRVSICHDGTGMRRVMAQSPADLVILGTFLSGEDGFTLTRSLRDETNVGIIILTGRGEIDDRIIGLEMGADDYMTMPFHLLELLARVKSVLRRASTRTAEKRGPPRSRARFDGWTLDLSSRVLFSPSGKEVELTTGEFDLLAALFDLVRNREETINVQVERLRRKLDEDDPQWRALTGDRRLAHALMADCKAKGWDALPLAPKELSRLFPELWSTHKAAERWLEITIGVWGVLVDYQLMPGVNQRSEEPADRAEPFDIPIREVWEAYYRPEPQESWSKALVRHGAEVRSALATVLGVPAEDILLRDCDS